MLYVATEHDSAYALDADSGTVLWNVSLLGANETTSDPRSCDLVVPEIEASAAYEEGGLIAITSAQARQTGPSPDASSCCVFPAYPNLPPEAPAAPVAGIKPTGGGGKVGLLLISPFVTPGSSNAASFNHYSLLFSIEELFGLERIGYAGEEALTSFDSSLYNAETSTGPTVPGGAKGSSAIESLLRGIEQQRQLPRLRQQHPAG